MSARNVRRLLSFQRYLRSSRFFRGITVPNSSNILDDDYNGQAKVGHLIFKLFLKCIFKNVCSCITISHGKNTTKFQSCIF